MLKFWRRALAMVILATNSIAAPPVTPYQQITESEKQEAREVAIQFTTKFVEAKDLTPLIGTLYVSDYIERYKRFKLQDLSAQSVDLYFVPGLDYNSRLLTEGGSEDWQRFYIAANNLVLLGVIAMIKNAPDDGQNIKATDMYPPSVIKLLNRNPNLANMIVRKGRSNAVNSVEEMRNATATLEQAVTIMRERHKGKSAVKIDSKELVEAMKEDEFFQPSLEVIDEEYFGFPKGARIILLNTPLLFRLMLTRDDNKAKIFWAEPYIGG